MNIYSVNIKALNYIPVFEKWINKMEIYVGYS